MYGNGESICKDNHFRDHVDHHIPVQVYDGSGHRDIGFIAEYCPHFVRIDNVLYNRRYYRFVSRPGY